jgi:hypothetical protein
MLWILTPLIAGVVVWGLLRANGSIDPKAEAHDAAWAPAKIFNEDRVTPFLMDAESTLREALGKLGLDLSPYTFHRAGLSEDGSYVEAGITETPLTVWLYVDGGQISTPEFYVSFEEWDAETPKELVDKIVAKTIELAIKYREAQPNTR